MVVGKFRGGKGGTFMIHPGRHLASLFHWTTTVLAKSSILGKRWVS